MANLRAFRFAGRFPPPRSITAMLRCWPLIKREMQVQARLSRNHWLRWAAALGGLVVAYALVAPMVHPAMTWELGADNVYRPVPVPTPWQDCWNRAFQGIQGRGALLLASMNAMVLGVIGVVTPYLTADCLSSERRQGTLGILLLTPMRTVDVVLAKWVVHGWQAVGVLLAALPILVLPVLLGGVSWVDGLRLGLLDGSILLTAATAGLVASSLWTGKRAVVLGATGLTLLGAVILSSAWAAVLCLLRWPADRTFESLAGVAWAAFRFVRAVWIDALSIPRASDGLGWVPLGLAALERETVMAMAAGLAIALGAALGGLGLATARVAAQVRARPQTTGEVPENCEPVAPQESGWFRRRRRGSTRVLAPVMKWNPFLWVELRTWRGQVVPWVCLAVVLPVECWRAMASAEWGARPALGAAAWVLAWLIALTAASCLYDERSQGSLEALLTLPGGARRLLMGKHLALALQTIPAVLLVLGVETTLAGEAWDSRYHGIMAVATPTALGWALASRLALAIAAGALAGLTFRGLLPACVAALVVVGAVGWLAAAGTGWIAEVPLVARGVGLLAWGGLLDAAAALACGVAALWVLRRHPRWRL